MRHTHLDEFLPPQAFQAWGPPGHKRMTLEGGGGAPKPDPMIGEAQKQMADLAVRQQDWYEQYLAPRVLEQMDANLQLSKDQAAKANEVQDFQLGLVKKYDDRYWGTQVPLEDQLIDKAQRFNEPAEREAMARTASGDVAQAFDVASAGMQRGLALRGGGINSGAATAMASDMATRRALAQAGAMTKTREAARQLGWTRLGEAAALGRGLPGFGAASTQAALGAGQAALGAGSQGMQTINSAGATHADNTKAVGSMWNNVGQIGVQKYNADVNAWAADQAASSGTAAGIGSAVGMIAIAI